MNKMIDDLVALQSENELKISRNITRTADDDQELKYLRVASNYSCFLLTSKFTHNKSKRKMTCTHDSTSKKNVH